MAIISTRKATQEDILRVLGNLRDADAREITCFEQAWELILGAPSEVGLLDGEPAVLYGIRDCGVFTPAQLWLVTTPLIDQMRVRFLRSSRSFVENALRVHGVIGGSVALSNARSQRWLRWLGFDFGPVEFVPPLGEVLPFERRL